jgi:hypothetical protein
LHRKINAFKKPSVTLKAGFITHISCHLLTELLYLVTNIKLSYMVCSVQRVKWWFCYSGKLELKFNIFRVSMWEKLCLQ